MANGATFIRNPVAEALQESAINVLRFSLERRRLDLLEERQEQMAATENLASDVSLFNTIMPLEQNDARVEDLSPAGLNMLSRISGISQEDLLENPLFGSLVFNRTSGEDRVRDFFAEKQIEYFEGLDDEAKERLIRFHTILGLTQGTPAAERLDRARELGIETLSNDTNFQVQVARVSAGLSPTIEVPIIDSEGNVTGTVTFDSADTARIALMWAELENKRAEALARERELRRAELITTAREIVTIANEHGHRISANRVLEIMSDEDLLWSIFTDRAVSFTEDGTPVPASSSEHFVAQMIVQGSATAEASFEQLMQLPPFEMIRQAIGLLTSDFIQRLPVEDRLHMSESITEWVNSIAEAEGIKFPIAIIRADLKKRFLGIPRPFTGRAAIESPGESRTTREIPAELETDSAAQPDATGGGRPTPQPDMQTSARDRQLMEAADRIIYEGSTIGRERSNLNLNREEIARVREIENLLRAMGAGTEETDVD